MGWNGVITCNYKAIVRYFHRIPHDFFLSRLVSFWGTHPPVTGPFEEGTTSGFGVPYRQTHLEHLDNLDWKSTSELTVQLWPERWYAVDVMLRVQPKKTPEMVKEMCFSNGQTTNEKLTLSQFEPTSPKVFIFRLK